MLIERPSYIVKSKTIMSSSTPELSDECPICCESYNKTTRIAVPCEHSTVCEFVACKACVKKYLLDTTSDPSCMDCSNAWSDSFLILRLTKSFISKEYAEHRKELLIQQQISRLPESMAEAEIYKRISVISHSIDGIKTQILINKKNTVILQHEYKEFPKNNHPLLTVYKRQNLDPQYLLLLKYVSLEVTISYFNDYNQAHLIKEKKSLVDRKAVLLAEYKNTYSMEMPDIQKELYVFTEYNLKLAKIQTQIKDNLNTQQLLKNTIRVLNHDIALIRNGEQADREDKKEARKFIMPCPNGECRGYLSTQYKCEMCNYHTCSKCFELIGVSKDQPHECKQENIDSADFIRKQSKPCPCCGTRISKVDGCDQMWCTQCHKAFSWRSGTLVTGTVHNPHFYQFQRQTTGGVAPRNPGDVVCGGLCDWQQLVRFLKGKNVDTTIITQLIEIHRIQGHFNQWYVNPLRNKVREGENYQHERVRYIVKEISLKKLGSLVIAKDKARKNNNAILHVCELFTTVAIDMFRVISESPLSGNEFIDLINQQISEYRQIREYCNDEFKKIGMLYTLSVPIIFENEKSWEVDSIKYTSKGAVDSSILKRNERREEKRLETQEKNRAYLEKLAIFREQREKDAKQQREHAALAIEVAKRNTQTV